MPFQSMQFRRGTAAEWSSANPVLAAGEPGYATDTRVEKIGDGVTPWNSLGSLGGVGPAGATGDTFAASPPATGTYPVGARVYNSAPSTGAAMGWVCITAGTPGVWAPFAIIGSSIIGGDDVPWTSTAFATAIPFDGPKYMPQQAVSGALAFTVNATGAQAGYFCYVRLVANGVNIPTFSGFTEDLSSFGYDNTASRINVVRFWYDGTSYWYSISQPRVDTIAPVYVVGTIANASPTQISVLFSDSLDASYAATSAWACTVNASARTVSTASVSGSTVTLTLASAVSGGDVVTLAYTQPGSGGVRDLAGNLLATFSAVTITNNVLSTTQHPRWSSISNTAETGNGTIGWSYADTLSADPYSMCAGSNLSLASGSDGWVSAVNVLGNGGAIGGMLGMDSANTQTNFTLWDYGIYSLNTGTYAVVIAGAVNSTPTVSLASANGDVMRLRASGTSMLFEVSKNGGSTWTTIHTATGRTATLYPLAHIRDVSNSLGTISASGMA